MAQGVGYALCEDLVEDGEGRILTTNFSTYILPSIMETTPVKTLILESPSPHGPFGVRSVGEPSIIPVAAAIANALRDAFTASGAEFNETPLTPARVRAALDAAGS